MCSAGARRVHCTHHALRACRMLHPSQCVVDAPRTCVCACLLGPAEEVAEERPRELHPTLALEKVDHLAASRCRAGCVGLQAGCRRDTCG